MQHYRLPVIETILLYYGFSRLPFGKNIAPHKIFRSSALKEASAIIEMGLESEDIIILTGPIGCGKSVALQQAVETLDSNRYRPIYLWGTIESGQAP